MELLHLRDFWSFKEGKTTKNIACSVQNHLEIAPLAGLSSSGFVEGDYLYGIPQGNAQNESRQQILFVTPEVWQRVYPWNVTTTK